MNRATARPRRTRSCALASAALSCGCFPSGPDFRPQRGVGGVRVLAVVPTPASGAPGARVELELDAYDGSRHPIRSLAAGAAGTGLSGEPAPLTIAWLGGCHNPPGDAHFGCYPLLQRIAEALPSPLPTSAADVPLAEREFWGIGTSFATIIPPDVLEGRELDTNALPFGVSFVFFAACRGRLLPSPEAAGVPLRCETESGEPVGAEGFVRGFSTVYTYAGSINQPPAISAKVLQGHELSEPACADDSDCLDLITEDFGSTCRSPFDIDSAGEPSMTPRRCLPSIPRCAAPPCRAYQLWPRLDSSSIEPDPAAAPPGGTPPNEIVWVKYYGVGGLSDGEKLINDRASGLSSDYSVSWRPPPRGLDAPVPVWAVVQDNRGGVSVARWDIVVAE